MSDAPIVVGTDGSPTANRAVLKAGELAGALGAPVHVVMSCESIASVALAAAGVAYGSIVSDDGTAREAAAAILDRARADLKQSEVSAEVHVCEGDPAEALLSVADGVAAQMIVVGNRGMSGARRVLGSVPNRVSHRASCAVLIVPTRT